MAPTGFGFDVRLAGSVNANLRHVAIGQDGPERPQGEIERRMSQDIRNLGYRKKQLALFQELLD
ncbi:MAG TPA: hypothetical protein VGD54_04950, partial [Steroidobacteraceae bacterium]